LDSSAAQRVKLQNIKYMLLIIVVMTRGTIVTLGYKFRWNRSNFLASEEVVEFHAIGACYCLFVTGVKDNTNNSHKTNTQII